MTNITADQKGVGNLAENNILELLNTSLLLCNISNLLILEEGTITFFLYTKIYVLYYQFSLEDFWMVNFEQVVGTAKTLSTLFFNQSKPAKILIVTIRCTNLQQICMYVFSEIQKYVWNMCFQILQFK